MPDQSPTRGLPDGYAPFALSIPIGLAGVVLSLLLGVRGAELAYPGAAGAALAFGTLQGALMGWRSQRERTRRTMDLGSGWRAPLLGGGLMVAALVFADPGEKSELLLYAGLLTTCTGLARTLATFLLNRRERAAA